MTFSLNKILIGIIIFLIIIGVWQYISLKSDISDRDETIDSLKTELTARNLELEVEKANTDTLKSTIESLNSSIKQLEVNNKKLQKEYYAYKDKLNKKDVDNKKLKEALEANATSCEDGLILNKIISEIDYADLK